MNSKIRISIAQPQLDEKEEQAVLAVLRSGNLAHGEVVEAFEKNFAEYIGTKYAIAVSNGTVALYLALLALGIGKDDEVITTPFSFMASTSMILALGAKPVFVDIDKSYTIDPNIIEKVITKKTKTILPVHLFGKAADLKKIKQIAKKYKLSILEDACQAHGAAHKKKKVGGIGDIGCFSFYSTKNMTTGEGGMITTNSKKIADKVKLLRSHGMKKRYVHEIIGFNFRMTNIQAALGVEQLKKLETFNKKRISYANLYNTLLKNIPGLILPEIPVDNSHVFHQYSIRVTNKFSYSRDALIDQLSEKGIQAGVYYPIPIHKQKALGNNTYGSFPLTEQVAKEILSLPIHPGLSEDDITFIANALIALSRKEKRSKRR